MSDAPPRPVQVTPDHYDFERYDDRERWMSYWHQLRVVLRARPASVLEIGPGSGVFRSYLTHAGVDVKTLDIDASRGVDYVADITRLDDTLPAGLTFDAICAFQVLELNPLPGMHPTHSDLPILWSQGGRSYQELVAAIVDSALHRAGLALRR